MKSQELEALGEGVRKQGYETSSMQDLVYNPETGEFEQRQHSEIPPESGIVVTEMTREGFAYASNI